MTRRKTALNRRKQIKTESTTFGEYNQHCEFCILSFPTRSELKAHVWTHFKKKICQTTQKTLYLIVDDWLELHINHPEHCDYEIVNKPVEITVEPLVKQEAILEENDWDNNSDDGVTNDEGSIVHAKIEESENDVEIDFDDFNGCLSDSATSSSDRQVKRAENTKTKSTNDNSNAAKQTTTKKKKTERILNCKSSTPKPVTSKAKTIKCRICKIKFTAATIIDHLQSRHIPKIDPIPTCETCGKTFSTNGNLRSHQYLHEERGRYICSYCGKEFVRNANLKEHVNLHTGARPFVCEVPTCKKTFHRETLLRNHRRVHTGEKKYRCNIENCERAYMFDIDLKRHKFSAHGIYTKKHPCFICEKVFSENKLLKKHLESHN